MEHEFQLLVEGIRANGAIGQPQGHPGPPARGQTREAPCWNTTPIGSPRGWLER